MTTFSTPTTNPPAEQRTLHRITFGRATVTYEVGFKSIRNGHRRECSSKGSSTRLLGATLAGSLRWPIPNTFEPDLRDGRAALTRSPIKGDVDAEFCLVGINLCRATTVDYPGKDTWETIYQRGQILPVFFINHDYLILRLLTIGMSAMKKRKLNGTPPDSKEADTASAVDESENTSNDGIEAKGTLQRGTGSVEPAPAVTKSFKDLGIIDSLCEACTALGYKAPTPIQTESIPLALEGRDLIGLAETGSGKTAAFAIPILQGTQFEPIASPLLLTPFKALMDKPQPLFGLVLAPTRELAYQISQAFEALGSLISVRCAVIVGGMDMVPQAIALGKKPHIVVATPGRLLDHLENTKGFSLRNLKYLVMDEADRLLDLDFGPILDKILKVLPRERRTYLFSATMTSKVESLQRASLSNPLRVSISTNKYQTVSTLLQSYLFFPHKHKDIYLVYLLNEFAGQSAIVFTRTVNETQRLAILLRSLGFGAIPLHGQLSQSARLGALGKFRAGSREILVATDVAARGLDIPSVDIVLNFDLPPDSKTYIHRVGRTARAGKSGHAISLVTQYDVEVWLRIEAALGKKLPEYETVKEEVMVFSERVNNAQRDAVRQMKDLHEKRGTKGATLRGRKPGIGGKGGKRGRDEMDRDEG
ncbi:ribosomal RNA processing protein [Acarospora aff. strigata]|nr:ribosomal RNA processing protein [Acarospora aff. strigata]